MSIETTLTLLIAGGILAAALVIRIVVMGLLRLGFWIARRDMPQLGIKGRRDQVEDALPSTPLLERLRNIAEGIALIAITIAATIWQWMRMVGRGIAIASVATYSFLAPAVAGALRATGRGIRAAYVWTAPRVATGAHAAGRAALAAYGWTSAHLVEWFGRSRIALARWWRVTALPFLKETWAAIRAVLAPNKREDPELFETTSPVYDNVIDLREERPIQWSNYRESHSPNAAPAAGGRPGTTIDLDETETV